MTKEKLYQKATHPYVQIINNLIRRRFYNWPFGHKDNTQIHLLYSLQRHTRNSSNYTLITIYFTRSVATLFSACTANFIILKIIIKIPKINPKRILLAFTKTGYTTNVPFYNRILQLFNQSIFLHLYWLTDR